MRFFAIAQICIGCALVLTALYVAFVAYELGHAMPACFALVCAVVGVFFIAAGDREWQSLLDEQADLEANFQDE